MNKKLIINELMNYYKFKKYGDFAEFLGIKPQVLSNWISRNTFDFEVIYTKCLEINPDWLMTGKGNMLRNESNSSTTGTNKEETELLENQNGLLKENLNLTTEFIQIQKEKIKILEEKLQNCENEKKILANGKSIS